jgi:hypothetical protein
MPDEILAIKIEPPRDTSLAFGERVGYIKPNAQERRLWLRD